MKTLIRIAMFGVLASGPAAAQDSAGFDPGPQELTGEWDMQWASAVRVNRDGSVEVQNWGAASLAFEQDGQSVTGSWTTTIGEAVTWTFEGTLREGRLRLTSLGHDSENPELAIVEGIVWQATLEDARLEGHVSLRMRGRDREPARHPFTAQRAGAG